MAYLFLFSTMTAEGAGRGKLTQLMTNHVLGNVNRYEFVSVMHCQGVTHKVGGNN